MTEPEFPSIPAGTPVDHHALRDFGARHSIVVNEAQDAFAAWIGEFGQWRIDLARGVLDFGQKQVRVQFLGSHSFETDTWLWGWGNQAYQGAEVAGALEACRWLRDASPDRERAWQLRTRIFPVDDVLSQGGVPCWPLHWLGSSPFSRGSTAPGGPSW